MNRSRLILLLAFALSVMADPVSSVAYAIESALRALDGNVALLVPTMLLVVAIIAIVVLNYRQLIARYPEGGGAAAAVGEAFGDAWAFVPIGALIVDFVLTIAISVSAASSAVISFTPALSPWRIPMSLALTVLVAALIMLGHLGRLLFAAMTLSFVVVAGAVLVWGIGAAPQHAATSSALTSAAAGAPVWSILLAFPAAMALATGVEAPSTAIAELGQLDNTARRRFGQWTLWMTLGVVGALTIGIAVEAHALGIGIPTGETTLVSDLARAVAPEPLFALFQSVTLALLLAAASSSFQAGSGLLSALARRRTADGTAHGILPAVLGRTNSRQVPYWGVVVFAVLTVAATVAAGARDQTLVLFYAVAVFLSFLGGLLAMAVFSHQQHRSGWLALNIFGAVVVAFTLVMNLLRVDPLAALAAALLIAVSLYVVWVNAGRPPGIRATVSTPRAASI